MRKTTGVFLTLMLMFSILFVTPLTASAATIKSQDGLAVAITIDKESYTADEDINLSITVQNTNAYSVENVSIEALLPAGLKLKSGQLTSKVTTLGAGEIFSVSAVAVSDVPGSATDGGTKNPADTTQPDISVSPKTGDDSNIHIWAIIFILSIVLCTVTFKYRKKANKILSVFLCFLLLGAIVPPDVFAAAENPETVTVHRTLEMEQNIKTTKGSYILKVTVEYDVISSLVDSDHDGLPDEVEEMMGLVPNSDDSDGDGLKDGFEFNYLLTDLTLVDSDGNGVSDFDEDHDGDGISNGKEQELGTRPDKIDTDGDGLSDGDEVNTYRTNPLKIDSDNDGLTDGEENNLGLNPNNPKSDGITPDAERKFQQEADDSVKDDALLASDSWLLPSISGNVSGNISKNVSLEASSNDIFTDNRSILSDVINLSTAYADPITLTFSYTQPYTGNMNNLSIVSFVGDDLILVDTTIDEDMQTISGEIVGNGTYFVVDIDEFLKGIGVDAFAYVDYSEAEAEAEVFALETNASYISEQENESETIDSSAAEQEIEIETNTSNGEKSIDAQTENLCSELETDTAVIEVEELSSLDLSPALQSTWVNAAAASSSTTMGKADIVFVLDVTGSMDDKIRNVANNINEFVETLTTNYNIDANFALITYNDYYVPISGKYGTRIHKNNFSNWFTNVNTFKAEVTRTANEDCGSGYQEVFMDGLGMAKNDLNWRRDASKFIVLITDESGDLRNNYGYSSKDIMAEALYNDNICVSVITEPGLQSSYKMFWEMTDGLYASIYQNFSTILLGLADKIGAVTNKGDWILLNDYQSVRLAGKINEISVIDSDSDGLKDSQELGSSYKKDLTPIIKALLKNNGVPYSLYNGATSVTLWNYSSNPVLPDTDFDGINDNKDSNKKDNNFSGKFYYKSNGKYKISENDIKFTVNYRDLFSDNTVYKKDLSVFASLLSSEMYNDTYTVVTKGASGGSDTVTDFFKIFGFSDVTNYKIDGSKYKDDHDDSTEIVIGHREVVYKGYKRQVVVVSVRGTNGTNTEWSSNFDVGSDTTQYYNATGNNHEYWLNKSHHKGFDVAANRVLEKVNAYLNTHSINGGSILITGHSRGGSIANLIGKYFEDNTSFTSYTYTFAAANTTTDENFKNYKSIFNIVNKDDLIPFLPLSGWGFEKYGTTKTISVEDHYENKWGRRQAWTWEWLVGEDYNNDGGTQRTLDLFSKIASNRDEVYILDTSSDGKVNEGNKYHTTYNGANKRLNELEAIFENEKLLRFCNLEVVGGGFLNPYHVEVTYCPAYLMQMLANMSTSVGPKLGHDTKGKYADAKGSFVASSGKVVVGGMTHPHEKITYYLIAYNNFVDKV